MILWLFSSIHHNIYINEQRCGITYKPAILKSVKTESNIYCIISCIYKKLIRTASKWLSTNAKPSYKYRFFVCHPQRGHRPSLSLCTAILCLSRTTSTRPTTAAQPSHLVLIIGICLLPWWRESGGGGYDGGIPDGVPLEVMRKTIRFWQKHSLTRDFYGSTPPPTSPPLDTHIHLNIVIKIP